MDGQWYVHDLVLSTIKKWLEEDSVDPADIVQISPITSTRVMVYYFQRDAYPIVPLAAVAVDTNSAAYYVQHWKQATVLFEKTGAGTCTVTLEGRMKDGNWYTIPSSYGGVNVTANLGAGVQNLAVIADLTGWYELRATVTNVVGVVAVTCTMAGGQ